MKAWLIRQKKTVKFPAPGIQVTAAVVQGRIRMWKYVDGNWNAARAAEMYKDLVPVLRRSFPKKASQKKPTWTVMEDNDPAGYKSRKALDAKDELNIRTLDLPKRSPHQPIDGSTGQPTDQLTDRLAARPASRGPTDQPTV